MATRSLHSLEWLMSERFMKQERKTNLRSITVHRNAYVTATTPLVIEVPPAAAIVCRPRGAYDPGTRHLRKG
jgi:hypothetical protein